jgi:hypothetical protein
MDCCAIHGLLRTSLRHGLKSMSTKIKPAKAG